MRLITLPGVFSPRSDAYLLGTCLSREGLGPGRRVLDVGTGSGILAVMAAHAGAAVTAVDVSRRALLTAQINARLNRVRIRGRRGDLLEPVRGERFDAIVSNPPYVPGPEKLPGAGPSRAWEGGADGRVVLDRLCDEAPDLLAPDGVVLFVHSSLCGEQATLDRLADRGLEPSVVARHRGPLGPLVAARASALERRGVLAPGQREEELVVIRGQRAAV
jgi:release factor glutamine methyltransferase